jgi:Domain of unknown function (DUF4278)
MHLNYRGLSYPSEATVESVSGEASGKYRGIAMKMGRTVSNMAQPSVALRYRGVPYNSHP